MHPLIGDLSTFKDTEIEQKLQELSKKYFMTRNFELQCQVLAAIDSYREELAQRRDAEWKKTVESRNKDLDKLINVD